MSKESADSLSAIPPQSPIYHAQRAEQYARQELIRQLIWRLWAKYFALGPRLYSGVYENARVSQIGAAYENGD